MSKLKEKYKSDFEQLRTFINEFDPCGLIALGCPVDEYDYLTNRVLGLSHHGESRNKIKETILFVVKDYFGEDIDLLEKSNQDKFYDALEKFLDNEQEYQRINKIQGLGGMTVNERLFVSGLMDEFDRTKDMDKSRAKNILRLLKVDEQSISEIID